MEAHETEQFEETSQIADIASKILSEKPKIEDHVLQMETQPEKTPQIDIEINPEWVDRFGRSFDPEIHVISNGKPSMTKTGKLRIKAVSARTPEVQILPGEAPKANDAEIQAKFEAEQRRIAASLVVSTFIGCGVNFFGEEWLPEDLATEGSGMKLLESDILMTATEQYMQAKNMGDFPPGVALSLAFGQYAIRRAVRPRTKSALQKLGDWLKTKASIMFLKFKERRLKAA